MVCQKTTKARNNENIESENADNKIAENDSGDLVDDKQEDQLKVIPYQEKRGRRPLRADTKSQNAVQAILPITYQKFMSQQHIVREGDCISSIAFEYGFHPQTIWDHPQNAELRAKRKEGTVLLEGDMIFIPDLRRKEFTKSTEAEHVFKLKAVPEMLEIRFLNDQGQPRANRNYILTVDGVSRRGKTSQDGFMKEPIMPNDSQAHLILYEDYEKDMKEEYDFILGCLKPVSEIAGIQARLGHLGYFCGDEQDEVGEHTTAAIRKFQVDNNLEATGEVDEQTRSKIKEIYGA